MGAKTTKSIDPRIVDRSSGDDEDDAGGQLKLIQ
jgi:hypothetical protein